MPSPSGNELELLSALLASDADESSSQQTSEESNSGSEDDSGSDEGDDGASTDSEGEQAGAGTDPDATTTTRVPFDPVVGGDEPTLCAAVIERLQLYRDATADELPDDTLTTTLEQFEAQIDVEANDQDWGDRIIEQLTNVRREWATARSAQAAGDSARAQERNEAALGFFDAAIDTECPTP